MQAETAKMATHWRTLGDAVKQSMVEPLQAEQQTWQARILMAQQGTQQQRQLMEQHIAWLKTKVEDTDLPIHIRADFKRDLQSAEQDLANFEATSKRRTESIASQWKNLGMLMSASISAPLLLMGRQITNTFATFQQSLANAGAVAKATTEEMARMEAAAREAGATMVFTAGQATDAMYYLASGGMSVSQQISAMSGVLDLAAATQSGLADAAAVTSNVLAAFDLRASESSRVANVFAAAINESMASLEKLSGGMRQVGPLAGALGLQLEEVTAALGLLYNAGYEGAQAGTVLRAALSSLANPTGQAKIVMDQLGLSVSQVNPGLHSLADILDTLKDSGMSVSQAMAMFGDRAGPGMVQLLNQGSGALTDLQKEITGTNTASETAARQIDTLAGSVKLFQSALEETYISLGRTMEPLLRRIIDGGTRVLEVFNSLEPSMRRFIVAVGATTAVVGPLTLAIIALRSALGALVGPGGLIILGVAALAGLGSALSGTKRDQEEYNRRVFESARAGREQADRLRELLREYDYLSGKPDKSKEEHNRLREVMEQIIAIQPDLAEGYDDIGRAIDSNRQKLEAYIQKLQEQTEAEIKIAALRAEADQSRLEIEKRDLERRIESLTQEIDRKYDESLQITSAANKARILIAEYEVAKELKDRDKITEVTEGIQLFAKSIEDLPLAFRGFTELERLNILIQHAEGLEKVQIGLADRVSSSRRQLEGINDEMERNQAILKYWHEMGVFGPPREQRIEVKTALDVSGAEEEVIAAGTNKALEKALQTFEDLLSMNDALVDSREKQIKYLQEEVLANQELIRSQSDRAVIEQLIFEIAMANMDDRIRGEGLLARDQLDFLDDYVAQYAVSFGHLDEIDNRRFRLQADIAAEDAAKIDERFAAAKLLYDFELQQLEAIAYEEGRAIAVSEKRSLYWRIMRDAVKETGDFTKEVIQANAAMELYFTAESLKERKNLSDEELRIQRENTQRQAELASQQFRDTMEMYRLETDGVELSTRQQHAIFNRLVKERLGDLEWSTEIHKAIGLQNLVFYRQMKREETELDKRAVEEAIQLQVTKSQKLGNEFETRRLQANLNLEEELQQAKGNYELVQLARQKHALIIKGIDSDMLEARTQMFRDLSVQHTQSLLQATDEDDISRRINIKQELLAADIERLQQERDGLIREARQLQADETMVPYIRMVYSGREDQLRKEFMEEVARDLISFTIRVHDRLETIEGRNLSLRLLAYRETQKLLDQGTDAYADFALSIVQLENEVFAQEQALAQKRIEMEIEVAQLKSQASQEEEQAVLDSLDLAIEAERRMFREKFAGTQFLHDALLTLEELHQARRESIIEDYTTRRRDKAYREAQEEAQDRIRSLQVERQTLTIPESEKHQIYAEVFATRTPEGGWGTETEKVIKDFLDDMGVRAFLDNQNRAWEDILAFIEARNREFEQATGEFNVAAYQALLWFEQAVKKESPEIISAELQSNIDAERRRLTQAVSTEFNASARRLQDYRVETMAALGEIEALEAELEGDAFRAGVTRARSEYEGKLRRIRYDLDMPEEDRQVAYDLADREFWLEISRLQDQERERLRGAAQDAVTGEIEAFGTLREHTLESATSFAAELRRRYSELEPFIGGDVGILALAEIASFEDEIEAERKRREEDYQQWLKDTRQVASTTLLAQTLEDARIQLEEAEKTGVGIEEIRRRVMRAEFDLDRARVDSLRDFYQYENQLEMVSTEVKLERVRSLIEMEEALLGASVESSQQYQQLKIEELGLLQDVELETARDHVESMARADETLESLKAQIDALSEWQSAMEDLGPRGVKALTLINSTLENLGSRYESKRTELGKRAIREREQMEVASLRSIGREYEAQKLQADHDLQEDLERAQDNYDLIELAHERHALALTQIDEAMGKARLQLYGRLHEEWRQVFDEDDVILERDIGYLRREEGELLEQAALVQAGEEVKQAIRVLYARKEVRLREDVAEGIAQNLISSTMEAQDELDIIEGRNLSRRLLAYKEADKLLDQETEARTSFALAMTSLENDLSAQEQILIQKRVETRVEMARINARTLEEEEQAVLDSLTLSIELEKRQLSERFAGTQFLHDALLALEELYQAKREAIIEDYAIRRTDRAYQRAQEEIQDRVRLAQLEGRTLTISEAERQQILTETFAAHAPEAGWGVETGKVIEDLLDDMELKVFLENQSKAWDNILAFVESRNREYERSTDEFNTSAYRALQWFEEAVEEESPDVISAELRSRIDAERRTLLRAAQAEAEAIAHGLREREHTTLSIIGAIAALDAELEGMIFEAERIRAHARFEETARRFEIDYADVPEDQHPAIVDMARRELLVELNRINERELEHLQRTLQSAIRDEITSFGRVSAHTIEAATNFAAELRERYSKLESPVEGDLGKLALAEIMTFESSIEEERKRREDEYQQWLLNTGQKTLETQRLQALESAQAQLAIAEEVGEGIEEMEKRVSQARFDFNQTAIETLQNYYNYQNQLGVISTEIRLEQVRTLIDMEEELLGAQVHSSLNYQQHKIEEAELLQDLRLGEAEAHLEAMGEAEDTLDSLEEKIDATVRYRHSLEDLGTEGAKAIAFVDDALKNLVARYKDAIDYAAQLRAEMIQSMAPAGTAAQVKIRELDLQAEIYRKNRISEEEIAEWRQHHWNLFLQSQLAGSEAYWEDWRSRATHTLLGPFSGLISNIQKSLVTTYSVDEETGELYSRIAQAWKPFLETDLVQAAINSGKTLIDTITTRWQLLSERAPIWVTKMTDVPSPAFLDAIDRLTSRLGIVLAGLQGTTGIDLTDILGDLFEKISTTTASVWDRLKEDVFPAVRETAPQLFETLKGTFGEMAGPLGEIFLALLQASEPLSQIWNQLGEVFQILADVIGHLLLPVFEMLWPAIKRWAWVFTEAALIVGWIWNALAGLVNTLVGWMGVRISTMDLDALVGLRDRINEMEFKTEKEETGRAGTQVTRMTGDTRNVFVELLRPLNSLAVMPSLFDSLLQRFDWIISTMADLGRGIAVNVAQATVSILQADIIVQSAGSVVFDGPVILNVPQNNIGPRITASLRGGGNK